MRKEIAATVATLGLATTAVIYNLSAEEVASIQGTIMTEEEYQFMGFITKYGRSYATKSEYNFRLAQFTKRLQEIEEHNSQDGMTSTVGINKFADYSNEEIKKMNGLKPMETKPEERPYEFSEEDIADAIDWRTKGAVTPVKNQGHCGSCWAFSTTGSIEGAHHLATGNLVSFSESNLVDCSWLNHGCNGGLMDLAFMYAEKHPLMTEADYPYHPSSGLFACKYKKEKGVAKVTTYKDVQRGSASQLKAALNVGPVSVGIEADKPVFHAYTGGIINSTSCGTQMDHGVLAVGYGTENGQEYYIVKNSWGADWGEKGFVRIAIADGAGICGIQNSASQPTTD